MSHRWVFLIAGLIASLAMLGCGGDGKSETKSDEEKTNVDSASEPKVSPKERFVGTWDTHAVVDKELARKHYSGPIDGEQPTEEYIETEAARMVNAIKESSQSAMKFDSDGTFTYEVTEEHGTWEATQEGDSVKLKFTLKGQTITVSPVFQDDDTFLIKRTPSPEEPPITHTIYKRRTE